MGNMSSVVGFESGFQILRNSSVVMGFVSFTCQNVHIVKIFHVAIF